MIGAIGFLSPWVLLGLIALPIIWFLLRAVPPQPLKERFPAVSLLLGLTDEETTPDRTPWWLLLLRLAALAAAIFGFANPVLNPEDRTATSGRLLIAMDASWASAQDWQARQDKLDEIAQQAVLDNVPVALVLLSDRANSQLVQFQSAQVLRTQIAELAPNAWEPEYAAWQTAFEGIKFDHVLWFSDGVRRPGQRDLAEAFEANASLEILEGSSDVLGLRPLNFAAGTLNSTILRLRPNDTKELEIGLYGPDPNGVRRQLAAQTLSLEAGQVETEIAFELPIELRNRVEEARIGTIRSAGAVSLADDAIKRRKIGLLTGAEEQEGGALLSGVHYLKQALEPSADLIEADMGTMLKANLDVIILDDVGKLSQAETQELSEWINDGGTLLRFSGPRLLASEIGLFEEHPLLPVRLRAGARALGGAMSWGEPRKLRAFEEDSPFFGLSIPQDVTVTSQVIAQPDPDLAKRVLASLADGTPLVTAKAQEAGRIILFHVTANTSWSNLPLSGLFVEMLERLAITSRSGREEVADLEGRIWVPQEIMNGFGALSDADAMTGIDGETLAGSVAGPDIPVGLYTSEDNAVALNAVLEETTLQTATWPAGIPIRALVTEAEQALKPWLLSAAVMLLLVDILATLLLAGRLSWARRAAATVAVLLGLHLMPTPIQAQDDAALSAANNTVLAYVKTGNTRTDEAAYSGLLGLSTELYRRTSIEPIEPVGVDIETDEIALYPFLYWPMDADQPSLSEAAIAKVNDFMRFGGLILFDTRDAHLSPTIGGSTPNGRKLQGIAARLDIPRIEPVPKDHVLTRSFYLMQDFPGRYANAQLWVEASDPNAEQIEGIPFRNLNDGVTPVVIGGNDWAAAWAVDENGRYLFPVGRGANGEVQREFAVRFGVNLLMYVMTGNYKSDQVHVPALLDRLGQ